MSSLSLLRQALTRNSASTGGSSARSSQHVSDHSVTSHSRPPNHVEDFGPRCRPLGTNCWTVSAGNETGGSLFLEPGVWLSPRTVSDYLLQESGTAASQGSLQHSDACSTNTAIPVSFLIVPEPPPLNSTGSHPCQSCVEAVESGPKEVVRLAEVLEERKKKALSTNTFHPVQIRDEWFCKPCKVWKWVHPRGCDEGNHLLAHHTACWKILGEMKAEGIQDIESYMFLNWLYGRTTKRMTRNADLERYRLYCSDVKDLEPNDEVLDPGHEVESPSLHQDLVL